jgi:hypothetical protein
LQLIQQVTGKQFLFFGVNNKTNKPMKKIIALLVMVCTLSIASFAQTVVKKEDKVKRTSTIGQKVHNTFSKHKHYSGYKTKHKKKVEKEKH